MKSEKTKTEVQSQDCDSSPVENFVRRCGQCLFAEGGDKFEFKNGTTNYRYDCTCRSRKDNIVFLDHEPEKFVWENQRACEYFEPTTNHLIKREDLDNTKFDFRCDGHFQIVPASA